MDLSKSKKTNWIEDITCKALTNLKAFTNDGRKKSPEIYFELKRIDPKIEKQCSLPVYQSYLSTQSKTPESHITKDVGSQGYYLKNVSKENTGQTETIDASTIEEASAIVTGNKRNRELERPLYPILEKWLQDQGFRTKDTSNMKGMGKWGNPDITGIKSEEKFGTAGDIEIATVEAKINSDTFQLDFFEAVSHKRFANRAYFAFAAQNDYIRQQNDELRYYSELYKVGVLVVAMDQEIFEQYLSGKLTKFEFEDVDVYEMFSAPYESKLHRWQKDFFTIQNITGPTSLGKWGRSDIVQIGNT